MTDETVDIPLGIVRNMRGVLHAFYLDDEILGRIREEEAKVSAAGGIQVINEGFNQALQRDRVICIIKDPRFRPPPEPTVVLVSSTGEILGTEVFPHTSKEYLGREDVIWLSDGFVVFPQVSGTGGGETFLMPPVSFPELNGENGCRDVVSCSPAPTCDLMIKQHRGLEDDPKLASIIVAYNKV
jgi:hypothetical protein